MDNAELLSQLRDIHLPEPVSMFPATLGWWLLALALLAALAVGWRYGGAWLRLRWRHRAALAELDRAYQKLSWDPATMAAARTRFANEANGVLRRVALQRGDPGRAARLDGAAWVEYLRDNGDATLLDDDLAALLATGRFRPHCSFDADALYCFAVAWIHSQYRLYPRRPGSHGKSHAPPPAAASGGETRPDTPAGATA